MTSLLEACGCELKFQYILMNPVLFLLLHFQNPHFLVWPGVAVKTEGEDIEVQAPVIISNVGMFTTFKTLLPPELQANPGKWVNIFNYLQSFKPFSTWNGHMMICVGNTCISCSLQRSRSIFMKPGKGFFWVFAGFNATNEGMGISSTNMQLYKSNNMDEA